MGLKSCDSIHFVQTISCGLLTKVPNADSHGSPATVYKNLKDVYEHEIAIGLQRYAPELVFGSVKVKVENSQFPLADRTLEEIEIKDDEFVCQDGDGVYSELDDDITLKQLKKRCLTKKRKYNLSNKLSIQGQVNNKPLEDDLYEPLINLKPKRSKVSKDKRKCKSQSVPCSSHMSINIKSEEILSSEDDPLQVAVGLDPVIDVKTEVLDTMHMECKNKIFSAPDDSSIGHDEEQYAGGVALNAYRKMVHNDNMELQHKYQNCVINDPSHNHSEDVEPVCMPVPLTGTNINFEFLELGGEILSDLPPLVTANVRENGEAHSCRRSIYQDANSDVSGISRCSSSMNTMSQQSSSSGKQVSNTIIESDYPHTQDDNLKCGSYPDSILFLQTRDNVVSAEDTITDEVQASTDSSVATMKNGLSCDAHFEEEILKAKENKTLESPVTDAESQSSLKTQFCGTDTFSTPELHPSPERLLLTKKAISPSSEERLCMAVNSIELSSDAGQFDCQMKLFGEETGKKASSVISEFQYDKLTDNHSGFKQDSPHKVIISSRNIIKRSKVAKGNLEGPHFSRSLPNLSTGCTSIQGCSESAVAFSQRQMHDMESLAEKLMNELKSMKDIIEQKLLFEAYRNVSLKSDADGVKLAINNATKVEDTAKRWLSMMSRDCNRFCKIMKMIPSSTTSKDAVPRAKRIVFADEAGGKLCHVKFYGDDDVLPSTDDERK